MHIADTPAIDLAQLLAQQFAGRAAQADREGRLPAEDVAALKESGYLTLTVPRQFGGAELSMAETLAAHVELARGSAASAMVAGMQLHIFGSAREHNPWSEQAFKMLCRAALDGALINSVASEPQLGSPSRGGLPATTATRADNGWRLNGQKTWTTGGRHLTHMLVRANVEGEAGVLLVLQDTPGVSWRESWRDALSLRASDSHDVFFNDVLLPEHHLLARGGPPPPPNAWFPMVMSAVYLGAALAARDAVIRFTLERVPTALGKPIATLPKIQRQIGEIDLALQAAQALFFAAATARDAAAPDDYPAVYPQIVAAKYQVNEATTLATDLALKVAGGSSITPDLPLERHFRDVRAGSMQPPGGDTALEIIGRHAIEQSRQI
ncbi:MAG: acyl-CoA dehydrogenase family protein [Anaerolineae bacterium]